MGPNNDYVARSTSLQIAAGTVNQAGRYAGPFPVRDFLW